MLFTSIANQQIAFPAFPNTPVTLLRLDQVDPVISGNKWFKLRYYLEEAIATGNKQIITFGGAWSNHIVATAAACRELGLQSTGIIRGEEPATWSVTLQQAREFGMKLFFLSRTDYAAKVLPKEINSSNFYSIPEGGYGELGVKGAATILDHVTFDFTHCCCAVGTGTMIAGLISAVSPAKQVIGINVLKNAGIKQAINLFPGTSHANWEILQGYHHGGYAKYSDELMKFMNDFYLQTGVPSDFVYTGKLFYAVNDLLSRGFFPADARILLIHSGGLQGNASLKPGTLVY